ncbi:Chloroperoxidase [Penicillium expansum]|nr:Chloroperoxidase [Penicillium expansum]
MRIFTAGLLLWPLSLTNLVSAFPGQMDGHNGHSGHQDIHKRCPYANAQDQAKPKTEHEKRFLLSLIKSPVDITNEHAFQPPDFENGDQRGPCPGLNALANHGYIPRSGVVSFVNVIAAINKVYGMGVDLATVLAIMGTVWAGDVLSLDPSFSIGGPDTGVNSLLNNLGGILGEPQGLINSHNFIEADSSNTRDDLYVTGNSWTLNMDKFMTWYNMSSDGTYDMSLMAERAKISMDQTIHTNPDFYYGPVTGLISRNAGYIFAGRLFRNHSAENPEGTLTKSHLRNFYGIYGPEHNLTYREGWERIPENWYKTPVDYGLISLNVDIIGFISRYPELGSIGGNMGKVDSFAGVDLGDVTGGVLNLAGLLKDNNLLCFVTEVLKFASPNALSGIYSTVAKPLEFVTNILAVPLLNLTCPAFQDLQMGGKPLWEALQDTFPGALKSKRSL